MANSLRNNPDIGGLCIQALHVKLSLYADYLLLYISNPHIAFPTVLKELHQFVKLSHFKINIHKPEALNVTLAAHVVSELACSYSFIWQITELFYLRVKIPSYLAHLFIS